MFLAPLVVFLGVKFCFRKSCLCKRNDKYEVWAEDNAYSKLVDAVADVDVSDSLITVP